MDRVRVAQRRGRVRRRVVVRLAEHVVLLLHARDGRVATDGWSKLTGHEVIDLAQKFEDYGVE